MPQIVTSSGRRKSKEKAGPAMFACVAVIVAVAVAVGLAALGISPTKAKPEIAKPVPAVEDPKANPNEAPGAATGVAAVAETSVAKPSGSEPEPTNRITGLPQSQHEAWQKRENERHAREKEAMDKQSPQYFDNPIENMIARVSRPNAKFLVPPTLSVGDEELMEILDRPIEILEDDTEEAIAVKERTAAMKEEIKKYISEGGTINQYFRDVLAMNNEKEGIRNDVASEKRRLLLEKGEEAAQAYLDTVNPQLKEMGLDEQRISAVDLRWMEKELAAQKAKEGKGQ